MSAKKKFTIKKKEEEEILSDEQLEELEKEEEEEIKKESSSEPHSDSEPEMEEEAEEKKEEEEADYKPQKVVERVVASDVNLNPEQKRFQKILNKQKKITINLPLYPGEKVGTAYESCTINDYRFQIPKGKMVEVPVQIAEMLMAHYNIQSDPSQLAPEYSLARNPEKLRDLE